MFQGIAIQAAGHSSMFQSEQKIVATISQKFFDCRAVKWFALVYFSNCLHGEL